MSQHNDNGTENSNETNARRGGVGVIRSGSHGRMLREPPQPAPNVEGYRKTSSGRFVGFDLVDPGLERGDSGQLRNVRNEQQLSRRELQARYGHHNTGERGVDSGSNRDGESAVGVATGAVEKGIDTAVGMGTDVADSARSFTEDLPDPGERRAAGGRRDNAPEGFVENLASGREADHAFVNAEAERARSGPDLFESADSQLREEERSVVREGFADATEFDVSDPDVVERVYETGWDETTPDSDRGRLDDTDVSFSEFGQAVETIEASGPRDTVGAAGAAVDELAAGRNPAETWSSDRR